MEFQSVLFEHDLGYFTRVVLWSLRWPSVREAPLLLQFKSNSDGLLPEADVGVY
jgi:hypothetical protein